MEGEGTTTIVAEPEEVTVVEDEKAFQGRVYSELERQSHPLIQGDEWYLLSTQWFRTWREYTTTNPFATKPGPIDNSPLLMEGTQVLRKNLFENEHFLVLPKQQWDLLYEWYGGGPVLARKVIPTSTSFMVEIRPLTLKILKSSDMHHPFYASFSKSDTVATLKTVVCEKLTLQPENVQVWDYFSNNKLKLLNNPTTRLDEAQILDEQAVLFEEKLADGTWPKSQKSFHHISNHHYGTGGIPGQTGLVNLGNTCFMNSALQCLSNTIPLKQYFLTSKYKDHINQTNPLGMKGELAEEFADLLTDIWSGDYSSVAPRQFKSKLERYAPQFVGFQQQDSQELLAFLLDGLHEDLNRVKEKPYMEGKESDGRPDKEVAQEAWKIHTSRNQSIIVDYFQGQLKSTLVCPVCSRVSVTFDPFMYLSLPLPVPTRNIKVHVVFTNPSQPICLYSLKVPKTGTMLDIKRALQEFINLAPEALLVTEVYKNYFFKIYEDTEQLDRILERDTIFVFELLLPKEGEQYSYVQILHKCGEGFGVPLIMSIPFKDITYSELYELLVVRLRTFLYFKQLAPKEQEILLKHSDGNEFINSTDNMEVESPQTKRKAENEEEPKASEEEEMEVEKDENGQNKETSVSPLFTLTLDTLTIGHGEKQTLTDERSFKLLTHQKLYLNWSPTTYKLCYDTTYEHPEIKNDSEPISDNSCTLEQCLSQFTCQEQLGPEDPWYCNRCKQHRQATKKFNLWKLPPILVIHLKRFSYRSRFYRDRLDTLVEFPLHDLDLSNHHINTDEPNVLYDLFAVSNHYGTMAGGHYTAYAKNKDGQWLKFDDQHVSQVNESVVQSPAAYVLFYRQRDLASIEQDQPTPIPNNLANPQDNNQILNQNELQPNNLENETEMINDQDTTVIASTTEDDLPSGALPYIT